METKIKAVCLLTVLALLAGLASSVGVTTALASIAGEYSIVWGYNASDISDPWKKHVPGAAIGNDLASFTPGFGYWVRVNATSATLTV